MEKIAAFLFDKDGTLFDFDATWSEWAADMIDDLADGDARLANTLADALDYDLTQRRFLPHSAVIAGTAEEQAATVAGHLPNLNEGEVLDRMNAKAAQATQVEVTPLVAFTQTLQARGFKIGVMTNDAESSARTHLHRAGVEDAFDFIAGYDSGYGAKPSPGPLLAFAKHCGLRPDQIAMVGDSTHDLEAGAAAGMVKIGVLTGPADAEHLAPYADVVLPSIADIPDWLDRNR